MQKFILTITTLMLSTVIMAQEPYKVYCALTATHSSSSTQLFGRIDIDYGQELSNKDYLVDESGKALKINTSIELINYMSRLGWSLDEVYTVGEDGNCGVWLMSKYVTSDEEITTGFQTRTMYNDR